VIGIIATDAVGKLGVPAETRETMEVFAPQIAIAIENARLYRKMQQQMEELKQNDAKRRELIANVSHDLRTPLTSLHGYIETLLMKENDLTEAERHNIELVSRFDQQLQDLKK